MQVQCLSHQFIAGGSYLAPTSYNPGLCCLWHFEEGFHPLLFTRIGRGRPAFLCSFKSDFWFKLFKFFHGQFIQLSNLHPVMLLGFSLEIDLLIKFLFRNHALWLIRTLRVPIRNAFQGDTFRFVQC